MPGTVRQTAHTSRGHRLKIGYARVSTDAQDLTAQGWYDNEVGEDIQLAQDFKTFVQALQSEDAFGAD